MGGHTPLREIMPTTPEKARASRRKHYYANAEYYRARQKERRAYLKEYVRKKKEAPCADCGGKFHYSAMDFDHRPGEGKIANLTKLVIGGVSTDKLDEEMAKCDLVCANCHRVRTYIRLTSGEGRSLQNYAA